MLNILLINYKFKHKEFTCISFTILPNYKLYIIVFIFEN